MRKSLIILPSIALALTLAGCGKSADAPKEAGASDAATTAAAAPAPTPFSTVPAEEGAKVAKARHEGFEGIGKAMKGIGDELKKPAPSIDTIKANAAKINEAAPKVVTWFPVGSGVEVAPKSDALPAIWEKPAEFQQAAAKLVDEAGKFNALAQAGDLAAIGGGMKALGGSCKGCHDQFKKKDD